MVGALLTTPSTILTRHMQTAKQTHLPLLHSAIRKLRERQVPRDTSSSCNSFSCGHGLLLAGGCSSCLFAECVASTSAASAAVLGCASSSSTRRGAGLLHCLRLLVLRALQLLLLLLICCLHWNALLLLLLLPNTLQ